MQSTEKASLTKNGDKSHNEWPSLNDCKNAKKPSQNASYAKNSRNEQLNKTPIEKSEGCDFAKENEVSSQGANGRGGRKKSSVKTKWVPVPIVPQPYKKRGTGRHFYDSTQSRTFIGDKKNESGNFSIGQENGRGSMRGNNKFRSKRGRGYSNNWRPRHEETSRGEIENGLPDATFETEYFYNSAMYYDPYYHQVCATALGEESLKSAIRFQIEYYFSDDNLVTDIFMRRKMDSQGYVPLTLISSFHRVKNLTKDIDIILESVLDSPKLEIVDNIKLRPVVNPLKWPLPDSSIAGLRTDVPEFIPGQPYVTPLVERLDNLNFNDVNSDSLPSSPDSAASLDQVDTGDQFGLQYYPKCTSPEQDKNYYTENPIKPFIGNGCDYYSGTPSPDEHLNGFQYYSEPISNGVLYYAPNVKTNDQIPNRSGFYYSSPDEGLSNDTDTSTEDQGVLEKNISPEPPR